MGFHMTVANELYWMTVEATPASLIPKNDIYSLEENVIVYLKWKTYGSL